MKLSDIKDYDREHICAAEISRVFSNTTAKGIKELEFTEEELREFLRAFSPQISGQSNVVGDEFKFWGVKIKRI